MNKPPYFPFYPKDFAGDAVVELMSTEAVGAYVLLMCQAGHEDPAGSIPDDDRKLARWARLSASEWSGVRNDVLAAFTTGDDGRLYQPRMVREHDTFCIKSNKASESAKRRWDRERDRKSKESQPLTESKNALRTHCEGNARASESGSGSNSTSEKKEDSKQFTAFWSAYPNKVGKGTARKAWAKNHGDKIAGEVMAGLARMKRCQQWMKDGGQFVPHPTTWLNRHGWEDEPVVPGQLAEYTPKRIVRDDT